MLWAKNLPLDQTLHRFTVGDDPTVDLEILEFDILASAAHARGLVWIGALTVEDGQVLIGALKSLLQPARDRELVILPEQEDCHTLLEAELTQRVGEAGKRIHLGRSRNDQVATAVRLWMRAQTVGLTEATLTLASALLSFGEAHAAVPMPGYTHGRRAMPSTIVQWAAAYVEALTEQAQAFQGLDHRLDKCPLGSGAGYGVPLAVDRQFVAESLGFSRVHLSPIDVQNSRGRLERTFLSELANLGLIIERLCQDLWLYTTEEFGFFGLPIAFTTGSSIMPQKRNPDAIELARGRCRELRGYAATVDHLAGGLSGGYHRDFQLLKKPVIEATGHAASILEVVSKLIPGLEIRHESLARAMSDDLYATQVAFDLVAEGATFRDAYRTVAEQVTSGTLKRPSVPPPEHLGSPGQPGLDLLQNEIVAHQRWVVQRQAALATTETQLFNLSTIRARS